MDWNVLRKIDIDALHRQLRPEGDAEMLRQNLQQTDFIDGFLANQQLKESRVAFAFMPRFSFGQIFGQHTCGHQFFIQG